MNDEGRYCGALDKAVLSKNGQGAFQVVLVFTVNGRQSGGEWAEVAPFTRNIYLQMSGNAKPYTKKKLAHLGIGVDGPPETETVGDEELIVLPDGIAGESIELDCKHDSYEGKTKEDWELANWGGGGTGEAASKEDAAKFKAAWGA